MIEAINFDVEIGREVCEQYIGRIDFAGFNLREGCGDLLYSHFSFDSRSAEVRDNLLPSSRFMIELVRLRFDILRHCKKLCLTQSFTCSSGETTDELKSYRKGFMGLMNCGNF